MIQANELRIGNIFVLDNKKQKIISISKDRIKSIIFDQVIDFPLYETYIEYKSIQPIPLTEEILLKCGFVKLKPQFSLSVGGESLTYYLHEESKFIIWYHGEKLGYSLQQVIRNTINPECTCFNTVHELQNIFYWNKKKQELEIKL